MPSTRAHVRARIIIVMLTRHTLLTCVQVWNFLHAIYGGGPVLKRREINIYTPPVP